MTTEPLKEENRHKNNVTCPMSHLVTGELFSFYPLLLSEEKKKKVEGEGEEYQIPGLLNFQSL